VFRQRRNAMDISIVEVAKTRKAVRASLADSINFDVPMEIVALTQHLSAIIKMIAGIIPMRLHAVSALIFLFIIFLILLFSLKKLRFPAVSRRPI
jgi:hypothetical protein